MALVSANFFNRHTNVLVIFGLCTLIVCHVTKLAGIELYLPRNSKIVYQNSRLSTVPTFNMIKVNRYDNQGKNIQNLVKKFVNPKNNRYTYLENRPKSCLYITLFKRRNKLQNVLNISRDTSNQPRSQGSLLPTLRSERERDPGHLAREQN